MLDLKGFLLLDVIYYSNYCFTVKLNLNPDSCKHLPLGTPNVYTMAHNINTRRKHYKSIP